MKEFEEKWLDPNMSKEQWQDLKEMEEKIMSAFFVPAHKLCNKDVMIRHTASSAVELYNLKQKEDEDESI